MTSSETAAVKRPNEIDSNSDNSEAKKVHLDEPKEQESHEKKDARDVPKGFAPIKAEFIVDTPEHLVDEKYINDDEAEGGDRTKEGNDDGGKKGKKKKGQNKNRDLKQNHEEVRLCSALVDPDNIQECRFGPDNCRSSHDVELYLQNKGEDVEGVCPVYEAIGYCPAGLRCRWLGSHYNSDSKKLLKDLEKIDAHKLLDNYEVNKLDNETKFKLQKKKYTFDRAESVTKYLDSITQNDKSPQEVTKDNQASYVESPFKPGEKKKINLSRAKIVSPLTTVGNLPYRRLMKTLGADITYCEMALSLPLLQGANAEWALPKAHRTEYPGFGVQIAAGKQWAASKAAEVISKQSSHVSELNLNCGCPIDLLYRQGQGSALLDQPPKLIRILKGMNACSGDIPVTVKIRTGTKDNKNTAKTLVNRLLKENDVAAITLHGRSRQQRYTKEADWDYVGEVGQVVNDWNNAKEENKDTSDSQRTQFVGNGDVFTHEDWYKGVNTDGIDSVMVARGALIKPWIFEEVEAQQYLDKSASERLDILRTYANFALEHWGTDEYGIGLARRFMCEFMSFTHRYIPVGILERLPPKLNQRPPQWRGRNELETLLASPDYKDWIKVTEMFFGKAKNFNFTPKHKSNSYEKPPQSN